MVVLADGSGWPAAGMLLAIAAFLGMFVVVWGKNSVR